MPGRAEYVKGRFSKACLLPAVLIFGCAFVASAAFAADWPEFLGREGRGVAPGPIR